MEFELYGFLCDKELPIKARAKLVYQLSKIQECIENLISSNQIPARSFDVYLGEIELALEKFEREFPKPKKPSDCEHPKSEMRLRHHADNTAHVVTQCLACGRVLDNHKKNEVTNWEALHPFEEGKKRKEEIEYSRWWESKNNLLRNVISEDGHYPEFSYEEFSRDYETKNPKPISPSDCPHNSTQLTLRRYSPSNTSIVRQCCVCGKHVDNVPKRSVKNPNSLPDFNCTLENEAWGRVSSWSNKYSEQLEKAKNNFKEELLEKIRSGEVSKIDKTTFGTYYESPEWLRTRERILARDEYECQACGSKVECVHHLTYDRLGKENNLDLMSLCNVCHVEVHLYQDEKWPGFRLTPVEIRNYFLKK
jgi:5-methylcytosine-specific restriction endonuclease McrA